MTIFLAFKESLSNDGTFTTHKQNIQNLAIEMFKALNDLSTSDFFELFQLNESLYSFRSNWPQKLCIPNTNSVRFGKVSLRYFGPAGSQQIVNVSFCRPFLDGIGFKTLENNGLQKK